MWICLCVSVCMWVYSCVCVYTVHECTPFLCVLRVLCCMWLWVCAYKYICNEFACFPDVCVSGYGCEWVYVYVYVNVHVYTKCMFVCVCVSVCKHYHCWISPHYYWLNDIWCSQDQHDKHDTLLRSLWHWWIPNSLSHYINWTRPLAQTAPPATQSVHNSQQNCPMKPGLTAVQSVGTCVCLTGWWYPSCGGPDTPPCWVGGPRNNWRKEPDCEVTRAAHLFPISGF